MEQSQKTLVVGIGMLAVGLIAGYVYWGRPSAPLEKPDMPMAMPAMHQMPDGSMMNNQTPPLAPEPSMHSMMMDMNAALRGKTGDEFDEAFLAEMIVHHQGAVDMAKLVLETSKRPELKKLANDIIAAQTKEIGMMEAWQKQWFK